MKKKRMKLESTVFLEGAISIGSNKEKRSSTVLFRCLTLILCVFTALLTLKLTIDMPINLSIIVFTTLFCIVFTAIGELREFKLTAIISCIVLLLVVAFIFRDDLVYGLKIIRTNFMTAYNKYFYTNFMAYPVSVPFMKDYISAKSNIMLLFSYLFCSYFAFAMKKGKGFLSLLLLLAFFFWGAVNLSVAPYIFPIILMLFSLVAICSLQNRLIGSKKNAIEGEFAIKKFKAGKLYRYQGDKLNTAVLNRNWISTITVTLSLLVLIGLIFPQGSYKPNKKLETIQKNPAAFVTDVFDQVATNNFTLNFSQSGIGGGNLTAIDRKNFLYQTHLKVTAQEERPMLLKGYVGSVYENDRWSNLNQSIYEENEKIFSELAYYDVKPQMIGAPFYSALELFLKENQTENELKNTSFENIIQIQNVNANRKYAYVPETLQRVFTDQDVFVNDTIIDGRSFGGRPYSISKNMALFSKAPEVKVVLQEYDWSYLYETLVDEPTRNAISGYEKFVYDHYLTLPQNSLQKLKEDFAPLQWDGKIASLVEPYNRIEAYFKAHAVYDLSPGKKPANKDYIEYFLYENHKGYCSHFATAATMMFRAMGIPARYVEGYTLTNYDIQFNRSGMGEILIKDSNAHAWTEIYLPALGWKSVDLTPGFSEETIASPDHNVPVPNEMNSSSAVSSEVSSEPPPVSSSVSNDTVSNNRSSAPDEVANSKGIGKTAIVFLAFFGVILAFFALLFMKNVLVTARRKSRFSQHNSNHAALCGYSYLIEILSFLGYHRESDETEQAFAKRVSADCKFLEDDSFILLTELSLKARFSDHITAPKELERITAYSHDFSNRVYKSLKLTQKFKYRLIDNLK